MSDGAIGRRTVGIIGGGQLARMLIEAGSTLGLEFWILDPDPNCPARAVCPNFIEARYDDARGLARLVEQCEVTTFDLEAVYLDPLHALVEDGHDVLPTPTTLGVVQDKGRQHEFFVEHGLPVPEAIVTDEPVSEAELEAFGFPLVQKLRRGGYDGRGVAVIDEPSKLERRLEGPSLLQRKVDIDVELAVVVARGRDGEAVSYPPVAMVFDPVANILDGLESPARVAPELLEEARDLSIRTAEAFGAVGVFAVEIFLSRDGELLVNEVAPRPHNSGHHTIDAWCPSQFELHLRAILGLPLAEPRLRAPSVMMNVLGAPDGGSGPAVWEGMDAVLRDSRAHLHVYGKRECRPGRKMGHLTVLGEDLDEAWARGRSLRDGLVVRADAQPDLKGDAS